MTVDYSGDGELVLGSFKSIRAFKKTTTDKLQAITQDDKYEIGKTYTAQCKTYKWDLKILMDYLRIPRETWKDTQIVKIEYLGMTWNIAIRQKMARPHLAHEQIYFDPRPATGPLQPYDIRYSASMGYTETYVDKTFVVANDVMEKCIYKHNDEVPMKGCTCGFYSFYDTKTMLGPGRQYVTNPTSYLFGIIENFGKVVHCTLGLRSEKMKILEVVPFSEENLDFLVSKIGLDKFSDVSSFYGDASSP